MAITETRPARPGDAAPIRTIPRSGPPIVRFYRTAVGKKWVMAITGVMLMGFVAAHLIGNLKIYLSKEEINLYGEALRDMPGHLLPRTFLLWTLRIGLIGAFVFHLHSAYGLTRINHKARPEKYQSKRDYVAADFASRTMRWTGIIVGLFIIFHLADLTWGAVNSEFLRGDPYNNLVYSLATARRRRDLHRGEHRARVPPVPRGWSIFQSMGINNPRFNTCAPACSRSGLRRFILVGNLSFPIAVQAHWLEPKCPHTKPPTAVCPTNTSKA